MGGPRHRLPRRGRLPGHEHSGADGAPPLPGATVADAAAGGMQAALAITAALAGRATTGRGAHLDVSVAEGVLWLMSLPIDEQLALGGDIVTRARHPLRPLRLLRHLPHGRRQVGGRGRDRGQVLRQPLHGAGLSRARRRPIRGHGPARHPGRVRGRLRHPHPGRVDRGARGRRHLCGTGPRGRRGGRAPPVRRPGGWSGSASHPKEGELRQLAPLLAGMPRPEGPAALPDMSQTDTEHLLKEAGVDGETVAALGRPGGRGMTTDDALAGALDLIGKEQYHEVGEFPSSTATSGRRAPRWRTATRCSGTTRSPRR